MPDLKTRILAALLTLYVLPVMYRVLLQALQRQGVVPARAKSHPAVTAPPPSDSRNTPSSQPPP